MTEAEVGRAVTLRRPTIEELAFRRDLLADPASMSYNVRWELDFPGYDNESGGLPFHEDAWPNILFAWSKPGCREYFLAFVDDQPVGHAHYSVIDDAAHIGVNIPGRRRGRATEPPSWLRQLTWSGRTPTCARSRMTSDQADRR